MKRAIVVVFAAVGLIAGCAQVPESGSESAADQVIASNSAPQNIPVAEPDKTRPGFDQESLQAQNV